MQRSPICGGIIVEEAAHPPVSYHTTAMTTVMQAEGAALPVRYHTTMTTIIQAEAAPTTMGRLVRTNKHTSTTMVLLITGMVAMGWLVMNKLMFTMMVLLVAVMVVPTSMGWLVANERTGTTMVLLVVVMVAPTTISRLMTNKHTSTTMVLLITVTVAPSTMGRLVMNKRTAMWQVADKDKGMAVGQLLVVPGTMMEKLNLIGSICAVCMKRSNTTVEISSRTVTEICLTLMESLMMHLCEQSFLALNDDWIVIQMHWHVHFIIFYCIAT
jgi:hypothetical protein